MPVSRALILNFCCHHSRFRKFGPLRYARITVDVATGRSRGTGFVCFWNRADADSVIEESNMIRADTTGDSEATLVGSRAIALHHSLVDGLLPAAQKEPVRDGVYTDP